ncbi:hypothetical protein [Sphaerisporangium siamense]|uniref:Uncharacterized protein n=1 Tax=Sphaerisporangium siamense TaxID=795645 RepID=A0A7W7DH68_9ACTN|nr:hypothetical protein [Sphaerisporangium siamense]MBB4705258.1 hypothetical protein [Sphaerisporangium siamense]
MAEPREDRWRAAGVRAGEARSDRGDRRRSAAIGGDRRRSAAIGEIGENDIEGYEFGYGPAFVLDPAQVAAVAKGLMGEGWGFDPAQRDPEGDAYEGFEGLGPFYAAAARDGKASVGGVS